MTAVIETTRTVGPVQWRSRVATRGASATADELAHRHRDNPTSDCTSLHRHSTNACASSGISKGKISSRII